MKRLSVNVLFLSAFLILSCGAPPSTMEFVDPNLTDNAPTGAPSDDNANVPLVDLSKLTELYSTRYALNNVYTKRVDDRGEGYENLYGVRNFRAVLSGIYYRGGGNNKYNRDGIRSNVNPLPNNALLNLCKEGFSEAIYYYSDNFNTAPATTQCVDRWGQTRTLKYTQITALKSGNADILLKKIFDRVKNPALGPIYGHCWNGWHASGLIAALALRQFCGWNGTDAEAYWIKNTDGNDDVNYTAIKNTIKSYVVKSNMVLTNDEKSLICPTP